MKKNSRKALAFFTILTIFLMTGCSTFDNFRDAFFGDGREPEATVRIGVFEPLSGPYEDRAKLEIMGIELAHELYPRALGKEVELIYADNQSDIYVAESVIQELIAKRPAVILGSYGSVYSLIAAEYIEAAKIPAITATNTNPLVTSNNPYYFRTRFVDSYEGVAVAKYAAEEMGVTAAAVLKPSNDDYAAAVAQTFSDKMIQLTGDPNVIVNSQDYAADAADFEKQLQKIKASGAKVVFFPSTPEDAAKVLKQAKTMSISATFLGTEQWETPKFVELAGKEAAEGVAFSTTFDTKSDITDTTEVFLDAYRGKYKEKEELSEADMALVALGFDAYLLAVDSLNRAQTALDGEKIATAISSTRQFPGASGNITFDSKGDPIKSVVIKTIRNGEIVSKYTVEPAWVTVPENTQTQTPPQTP